MCENKKSGSGECHCKVERVPNFALPRLLLELAKKTSHGYELIERLGQEGNATPGPIVITVISSVTCCTARWEASSLQSVFSCHLLFW